jgi:excisionase family DNA binding protein
MSAFEDAARELDDLKQRVEQLEALVQSMRQRREGLPRTAYKPSEVAAMTGWSTSKVRAWIRDERLPAEDMGNGRYAVPAWAVERLFPQREPGAQAAATRAFYSVREFAAALGVGIHVIYRATDRDEIAWTKVGGSKRIPHSELERLLSEAHERQ